MHPMTRTARTAGLLYLVIVVCGMFAQFFVRDALTVPGDPAATAAAIAGSEGLFRAGIAADLVMIASDVAIALAFLVLFRSVSRALATLAAFFRLTQATILGFNLLNLFFVLHLLNGGEALGAFGEAQRRALALLFLDAHAVGYTIGLVFFALSLLVLGVLVLRSSFVPRIFGVALAVAGVAYLFDGFALTLFPAYAAYADLFGMIVLVPAFVAELSFALWLLIRGVRIPERAVPAPAAA